MGALTRWRRNAKELIRYLNDAARSSADYSERHFRFLGCLTVVVPAAYGVDYYVGSPNFDTLLVRLSAFLLSIPLILYNTPLVRSFQNFHIYFVLLVAYVLPFTFGLMLTLNAAMSPYGNEIEILWILQYFISLFLFIQLIHNGPLATLLWCVSTAAAVFPLVMIEHSNWDELRRVMIYPVTGYLTALFFGIITNRNVDYVNSEKLRAASAIGGNIAHELRTPLASIRSLAKAVNKHSETLVQGYEKAQRAGLEVTSLNRRQIEGLRTALRTIEEEVAYSNTIIDMLLINTSDHSRDRTNHQTMLISSVVHEAIKRYPFNNSRERSLIEVSVDKDFHASGSRVLLVHVFFNLLKNGIFYAQKNPCGAVAIQIWEAHGKRVVEVSDTGPGMISSRRRHVFDRFFTTASNGQGAGIGLSFCKMVMESLGGDIQCESREGEYTTFRLIFPPVSDPQTPSESSS